MKSYMECYRERIENNHNELIKLAEILRDQHGCKCFRHHATIQGLVTYILIEKDGKKTYAGFAEVPYRWFIDPECRTTIGVAQTRWDDESRGFKFPFTVEEVLKSMRIFKKPKYNFYVEIV